MYRNRTLQLFYILGTTPKTYYRSADLANMTGVTDRTIKNDIREVGNMALDLGARIISHKGKGYCLEILDEEVFKNAYEQLEYHLYTSTSDENTANTRVIDILKILSVKENYVTADDIAEEMYLAKSSIRDEMVEVNKIIRRFNLSLKKRSEDGPMLKGSELNRRLLFLYLFDNSFHDAIPIYADETAPEYYSLFEYDDDKRREIRHIFLHILRDKHIRIVEGLTPVICRYLCLIVNRYKNGYHIVFDYNERKLIDSLFEREVSDIIFEELKKYDGYDVDEDEKRTLALLLACFRDIQPNGGKLSSDGVREVRDITDDIFDIIKDRYHIDFSLVDNSYEYLLRSIAPMMLQKEFGIVSSDILRNYFNDIKNVFPVSILFASIANDVFERRYGCYLSEFNLYMISTSFQRLLFAVSYDIRKINAMIICGEGINSSYMIYDFIMGRYGGMFNKLDCYELYEPREIPLEEYDWVIGHIPVFSYRYDWPVYITDPIPTNRQIDGIYNEVILSGVNFEGILNNLHYETIDIFDDYNASNHKNYKEIISYRHGKDAKAVKHIRETIDSRTFFVGKTMFVFIDRVDTRKSVFEIYQFRNAERIFFNEASQLIVMTLDAHDSLETIRFMNDCLYMICIKTEECIDIIRAEGTNGLTKIAKMALKSLPISFN